MLAAQVGFSDAAPDAGATRAACVALRHLAAAGAAHRPDSLALQPAFAKLAATVAAGGARQRLPEAGWYGAAEAAVAAVYALHPAPDALCAALLRRLAAGALGAAAPDQAPGPARADSRELSHFFFVLGQVGAPCWTVNGSNAPRFWCHHEWLAGHACDAHSRHVSGRLLAACQVALQHLVHIERMARQVNREAAAREKAAALAQSERHAAGAGAARILTAA